MFNAATSGAGQKVLYGVLAAGMVILGASAVHSARFAVSAPDALADARNEPAAAPTLVGVERQVQQSAGPSRTAMASTTKAGLAAAAVGDEAADAPAGMRDVTEDLREPMELTEQQRAVMAAELTVRLPASIPDRAEQLDWRRRYAQYDRERRIVLKAGLSTADEQEQIERLLNSYFRPDELSRVRAYKPESR